MKKAYIQPEVELLSLAALEDFLGGSAESSVTDPGDGNDWDDTPTDGWA